MATRTTLMLDDDVRSAARELAHRYGCSTAEAIRRAVLRHRDTVMFDLFQDHEPAEEVRCLKQQDEGF